MVITDGAPSVPTPLARLEAQNAADAAKRDGTLIYPVFISTGTPEQSERDRLYMEQSISTDGVVLGVEEYSDLDMLLRPLTHIVACREETIEDDPYDDHCEQYPTLCFDNK